MLLTDSIWLVIQYHNNMSWEPKCLCHKSGCGRNGWGSLVWATVFQFKVHTMGLTSYCNRSNSLPVPYLNWDRLQLQSVHKLVLHANSYYYRSKSLAVPCLNRQAAMFSTGSTCTLH